MSAVDSQTHDASIGSRETPDIYKLTQWRWRGFEIVWMIVHYALGLMATMLAFLAASDGGVGLFQSVGGWPLGDDFDDEKTKSAFTMAAGLCAAIITFLEPGSRRKAFTDAIDLLRITRLRFEACEKGFEISTLHDALEKAQDMVGRR